MKKKILTTFFLLVLNFNLYADENNKSIRIGLLAPLTGTYSELGNSLLYSLQLALEEINDENVIIVPRDSGFNDKEKLNKAINEIKSNNVKVIIGPITNEEFEIAEKHNDLVFISPSNINSKFSNNIISIGISLESQLLALLNFIKKQKKNKTVIMYPENQYLDLISLIALLSFSFSLKPESLGTIITFSSFISSRASCSEYSKELPSSL